MSDELLNQAQIAREFGVSKGRVTQAVGEKKLNAASHTKTGKPLYTRADAKKVFGNSQISNRKINAPRQQKSLVDKKFSEISETKLFEPPTKLFEPEKFSDKQTKLFTPDPSDVEQWMQTLLGDDFSQLDDSRGVTWHHVEVPDRE